jgi:hypothetical protein
LHDEKPIASKMATDISRINRFISTYLNFDKFARKNCISKICAMTSLVKFLPLFALAFISLFCHAQSTQVKALDNSIYLSKNLNGLNALTSAQPAAGNVKITCYVKTGTVYENDSVSGISYIIQNILADKVAAYLRQNAAIISFQNTSLSAYTTTELSVFELTSAPLNYPACLQLLRDSIFLSTISEEEIKSKVEAVRKEIADGKKNPKIVYETNLLERLYRQDANKIILVGDTSGKYPYVDLPHIERFRKRYYVPNNTLVNAIGNLDVSRFQEKLAEVFNELHKSEFDPEIISKIIDFKPMVYTTQFVVNDTLQQPRLEICWQFPGVRSNVKSSYYAFLLSAMLNDPNNFIQVKARKMGCKKFEALYDANNFSGTFKIVLQPDKQHFFETYQFVLKELMRMDETLVNESMMKVGMLNFQKEYNKIRNSPDYMQWITKYWVYDDETYFSSIKDSVFLLGERRMRKFVIEYIKQSAHVTGLVINSADRAALQIDSLMPDLDPSVNDYVFKYRPNITDLEGADNLNMQSNLLHWLKANPDLVVQVNGFSDKGEFNRAKDDSIRLFIDSVPTYRQVKQDLIKRGSIRIEMLRALKIIKYLYDHGVEIERLKGTSMPFSSKTREEALENMKCTLTLDKIRKSPSVYEYHYGKKKDNNYE